MLVNLPKGVKAWMETDGTISGRVQYLLVDDSVEILQLSVTDEIGKKLLDALRVMSEKLTITISEYDNLTLHWLISYGFRAINVKKDWVRKGVDGYVLSFP